MLLLLLLLLLLFSFLLFSLLLLTLAGVSHIRVEEDGRSKLMSALQRSLCL